MIVAWIIAGKRGYKGDEKASAAHIWTTFKDAILALLMPAIILGGIYGGVFTPTEAAVVGVVYGFVIGFFGGFSTFSTAVNQMTSLVRSHRQWSALAYLAITVLAALACLALGWWMGSLNR